MDKISSIRDLIALWPTRATLAQDLNMLGGLTYSAQQVHKWAENGAIPARHHHAVLLAARNRGFDVTADLLVALHAPRSDPKDDAA